MSEDDEPTYEQLQVERAKEWAQAQALAAKNMSETHARLAAMPDVVNAPAPDQPWSHPLVKCACGHNVFRVSRYITCNGLLHRVEATCLACEAVGTWDRATQSWVG